MNFLARHSLYIFMRIYAKVPGSEAILSISLAVMTSAHFEAAIKAKEWTKPAGKVDTIVSNLTHLATLTIITTYGMGYKR